MKALTAKYNAKTELKARVLVSELHKAGVPAVSCGEIVYINLRSITPELYKLAMQFISATREAV